MLPSLPEAGARGNAGPRPVFTLQRQRNDIMTEYVPREECMRTHEPIAEFKKETSDNFVRLHARIDKIYVMIVGVLLSIIASIAAQAIMTRMADKTPPKIEIVIDKASLGAAARR